MTRTTDIARAILIGFILWAFVMLGAAFFGTRAFSQEAPVDMGRGCPTTQEFLEANEIDQAADLPDFMAPTVIKWAMSFVELSDTAEAYVNDHPFNKIYLLVHGDAKGFALGYKFSDTGKAVICYADSLNEAQLANLEQLLVHEFPSL